MFADDLFSFLDNNSRKSIPLDYFRKKGYIVKNKLNPRVDYLEIIDRIYGGIQWIKMKLIEEIQHLLKKEQKKLKVG